MRNIWTTRLLTFALWLLAAASAAYWLIQTTARAAPNPALARADVAGQNPRLLQPDTLAVAHGLGAVGDAPVAVTVAEAGNSPPDWQASRYTLTGIVAQGSEADGLVMLSVDGKPAQILRLGEQLEAGVVVQALSRQSVTLANISQPDEPKLLTLKLGERSKTADAQVANTPAPSAPSLASEQAPAFPSVSAVQTQQAPGFPSVSAAAAQAQAAPAFPVPAAAPEAAAAADANAAAADNPREERRARMAERLEQRRAAAANASAAHNATPVKNTPPATPRSVLADDNLYFGD